MFQVFNQETNTSSFIKALLSKSNIPMIDFIDIGSKVIKNNLYIHDGMIVKAKETETLTADNINGILIKIKPYSFGDKVNGITTSFTSPISYYDSDTHKYLGEYLRAIKGYYGLNLLPFYNCFNNKYSSDFYLTSTGNQLKLNIEATPDRYKILLVPVKFNRTYTIAIDSQESVIITPLFYGNKGLASGTVITDLADELLVKGKTYDSLSFKSPVTFDTNEFDTDKMDSYYSYEKFLYLAIQLSESVSSNIVVLEGDYTHTDIWDKQVNNLDPNTKDYLDNILISPLSLLQMPGSEVIAFSDRLIEYLTQNVITDVDDISENITRTQAYCSSIICKQKNGSQYTLPYTKGIWDDSLRLFIYDLMKQAKNNLHTPLTATGYLDITGFVDKDSETIITRGQIDWGD